MISTWHSLKAQINLVPNYSFESYINCPNHDGDIVFANPWFSGSKNNFGVNFSSTDYFNSCNTAQYAVPNPTLGMQNARTGNAFAGLVIWINNATYREYIEVKLTQPLEARKKYCAEFWVNYSGFGYAIDAIGMTFSKDSLLTLLSTPIIKAPDIENDAGNIIADTVGWTRIGGEYIAQGGEQFITIGCFIPDNNIQRFFFTNSIQYSYYILDDVSVTLCEPEPPLLSPQLPNVFTPNEDGINDVFAPLHAEGWQMSLEVFNLWGAKVYSGKGSAVGWDGKNAAEGVYYYVLHAWAKAEQDVWLKGTVELVR